MKRTRFFVFLGVILSLVLFIAKTGLAEDNPAPMAQDTQAQAAPTGQPPAEQSPTQQPAETAAPADQPAETAAPAQVGGVEVKAMETPETIPPSTTEFEMQWVWGDIVSLDPQNKEVAISYFDYETDTEKELKLTIDDNSKYENINSLNDLKLHDTISVDYILTPDGKYTARNISVEKPEEIATTPGEQPTDKPVVTSTIKPG